MLLSPHLDSPIVNIFVSYLYLHLYLSILTHIYIYTHTLLVTVVAEPFESKLQQQDTSPLNTLEGMHSLTYEDIILDNQNAIII